MNEFAEVNAITCSKNEVYAPLYSSLATDTEEQKKIAFNAISNPTGRVSDLINKTIKLKNVMCEMVPVVNEETENEEMAPRIILIDENNNSYQAVSWGLRNSLARVFTFYDWPTEWKSPVSISVQQIETKKGRTFSIKIV